MLTATGDEARLKNAMTADGFYRVEAVEADDEIQSG
jgi:hypothetical protein